MPRGGASPNETLKAKPGVVIEPGTCGAGASADKTVLKTAPKDTQWVTTESGWTGPVSQTAGPVVESPIRSCFEHSAQGALYAAAWAVIHVNDSPEAYMPTVIGPGAEQITKERLQDTKTRTVVRIMGTATCRTPRNAQSSAFSFRPRQVPTVTLRRPWNGTTATGLCGFPPSSRR